VTFARPVTLRSRIGRLPAPSAPVIAGAAAVGVGAAALGWHWYARRKRQA
jgi:hypothetical protein